MAAKKIYSKPVLEYCGLISERTLGNNGYNCDPGDHTQTKMGGAPGLCDPK